MEQLRAAACSSENKKVVVILINAINNSEDKVVNDRDQTTTVGEHLIDSTENRHWHGVAGCHQSDNKKKSSS